MTELVWICILVLILFGLFEAFRFCLGKERSFWDRLIWCFWLCLAMTLSLFFVLDLFLTFWFIRFTFMSDLISYLLQTLLIFYRWSRYLVFGICQNSYFSNVVHMEVWIIGFWLLILLFLSTQAYLFSFRYSFSFALVLHNFVFHWYTLTAGFRHTLTLPSWLGILWFYPFRHPLVWSS